MPDPASTPSPPPAIEGGVPPLVSLVYRRFLAAPPEEVWPWLVEPERVREYHLTELRSPLTAAGDPVRYVSKVGGQAVVEGKVLELVPDRRLSHTFLFVFDPPELPGRVTYELLRYGDRLCRLEVRHDDLDPAGETFRSVSTSWDIVLCSLKTLVETGQPLPWPTRSR